MILFSNAKINLGLYVTEKRSDGFHNLETCFYPVDWVDVLEVNESSKLMFESVGISIPGNPDENLCLKAYHLLKKDFDLPPVYIHLLKNIPIGAGLGGGSSNASFTLKGLNGLFDLGISDELLVKYAAQLGSDCPFFIHNKGILAFGTGDEFRDIEIDLSDKKIMLVYPSIHISTARAFLNIMPRKPEIDIASVLQGPIGQWREHLINDFELSIFNIEIDMIKKRMYEAGAEFALMSGSGSSVFGIFDKDFDFGELEAYFLKKRYLIKVV